MTMALARKPVHLQRSATSKADRFHEPDQDLATVRVLIRNDPRSIEQIAAATLGFVTVGTLKKWEIGAVRRPQNFTMSWVLYALGKKRAIVDL